MSEPLFLIARVNISEEKLEEYLLSPIFSGSRFTDWDAIRPDVKNWVSEIAYEGMQNRKDWLQYLLNNPEFCASYSFDVSKSEFILAAFNFPNDVKELVRAFNVLRDLSEYKNSPKADFVLAGELLTREPIAMCRLDRNDSSICPNPSHTAEFAEAQTLFEELWTAEMAKYTSEAAVQ